MPVSAFFLVLLGVLLIVVGILGGGNLAAIGLGVVSLVAGGVFETIDRRRS